MRVSSPTLPGRPVLVVDDDEGFCTLATCLLESAGYSVRRALTGQEALESAHSERPALVLLDVHLPDLSGYEVCRSLRKELGDDLPIMFVSGERTESFDRVAGLIIGADDYLVKPFAPDELLARVRRLIEQSLRAASTADSQASRGGVGLTRRELEVLGLLAEGLGPAEVGRRLDISRKTVGTHIEHIYRKLDVHTRAEAVARAYQQGLVPTAA